MVDTAMKRVRSHRRIVGPAIKTSAVASPPLTFILSLSSPGSAIDVGQAADSVDVQAPRSKWPSVPLAVDPPAAAGAGWILANMPLAGALASTAEPVDTDPVWATAVAPLSPAPNSGGPSSVAGGNTPVAAASVTALTSTGIPERAYAAYLLAQTLMARDQASCHVTWPVLAGIGRVESNHGRFNGSGLTQVDQVTPPIFVLRMVS